MKNSKIFAISSVLAILLTACGGETNPSTEQNSVPGFTYTQPTDTFVDASNTKIDFKGNDLIKNVLTLKPGDDAEESKKVEWFNKVIDTVDKNQIVPNKVTYDLVEYEKRDYGQLDVRNKDIAMHYEVTRNQETYAKNGSFTYKAKTFSKQLKDPADKASGSIVVADTPLDYVGTYTYTANLETHKFKEETVFSKGDKKPIVKEDNLNWTTLNNAMILSDLTSFKVGYKNLIDYVESKPEASDKMKFEAGRVIKMVGEDICLEIHTLLKNLPDASHPDLALITNRQMFGVLIAKEGYVKEAYRKYEDEWTNAGPTDPTSLEKLDEKYTFSL